MKFKGDLVYTEKYTDKKTGEEKKKYTNIGAKFERDDGSECYKVLGSWVNLYPPKFEQEHFDQAKEAVTGGSQDHEDEIPFAKHIDVSRG